LAAAVVASLIVANGAAPTASPRNSHVRGVVLFVGDSNITLAANRIVWALTWEEHNDNGYVPIMASRVGSSIRTYDCLEPRGCRTTEYWKQRLGELLPSVAPDVVVTNLGVNDTGVRGSATTPGSAGYDEKIDWFMELLPADTPVLWTTSPCDILPPERSERCAEVNRALTEAPERWSNLTLVDWEAAASGHPEYINDDELGIHYGPAGHRAWTELVLGELDELFPPPEQ
jgi:lysophospholipase L1-like esterase